MKFDLSDFLELDTKALLAVNGGSDCSTSYSGPSSDDSGSSGNGPGSSTTTSGSKSGGGYCSGASDGKTVYKNPYYKNPGDKGTSTVYGGGTCTSFDLTPWAKEYEDKMKENDDDMKNSIKENIDGKKYTDDYMCDNWVAEVLADAGHDVSYYFNGDADDTVQQHIDGLKEGAYSKKVPTRDGVYVVFMNDGHFDSKGNQLIPHAGILVVSKTGQMTMYDNSSHNSNGGIEATVVSRISDTKISCYGYDSYYFQQVSYAH